MLTKSIARRTAAAFCACAAFVAGPAAAEFSAARIGGYETKRFDEGVAEITAYDKKNKRLFVVNGGDRTIDVLDFADPTNPTLLKSIDISAHGKAANSIAVHGDLLAAAVEAEDKQANGKIVLMDLDGALVAAVEAGALPDMVTFTPDGAHVLAANEGEPSDDFANDPEGSVTILKVSDKSVRTVGFSGLTKADFGEDAHWPSPEGTSVAQDLEPEYIAVSPDGAIAFVSFQENNAMAVIDIETAEIERVFAFKRKDWRTLAFDVSDKDDKIQLNAWPVLSMPQPDAIAAFEHDGQAYVVTANEGDARDYDGYSEETRVEDLTLDPTAYPNAAELQAETALGRLKTTTAKGDSDGDGDIDQIHAFGGRSFSIYAADGSLVFDSGDAFERILSERHPSWFNGEGQESNRDNRSDDKGTEPEGVALGVVNGTRYAFIGLERMGGVMVYDLTDPAAPSFVDYLYYADPTGDAEAGTAGDVAPEGLTFIAAEDSPTGAALLVVANEVSGSVSVFEMK